MWTATRLGANEKSSRQEKEKCRYEGDAGGVEV